MLQSETGRISVCACLDRRSCPEGHIAQRSISLTSAWQRGNNHFTKFAPRRFRHINGASPDNRGPRLFACSASALRTSPAGVATDLSRDKGPRVKVAAGATTSGWGGQGQVRFRIPEGLSKCISPAGLLLQQPLSFTQQWPRRPTRRRAHAGRRPRSRCCPRRSLLGRGRRCAS